jgi:hypothetical protein
VNGDRNGTRAVQIYQGLFTFKQLVWHTLITVGGLPWCHWIRFVKFFPTVLMVSSSELQYVSRIFSFFLLFSLSPLSSQITRRRKKKETKKRLWRYTKASIITPTILLEIFQWDEPNYINKGHQQWIECGTRVVWRKMSLKTFGWLLWSTPVTVCDISWCHWIHLVNIFPTVLVVSYRSFDVSSRSFSFLSLSLSLLSLL